jgi:uncharacterized NAD(P)/FAD-binding protein YdhS
LNFSAGIVLTDNAQMAGERSVMGSLNRARAAAVVVIVGAGFSGTSTAVQLLLQARRPLDVVLIDRETQRFARGLAYSTFDPAHRLNVPAGNMSLFPDRPADFVHWLQRRGLGQSQSGGAERWYAPRQLYGQYLDYSLSTAASQSRAGKLIRLVNEATDIELTPGKANLTLSTGETLCADAVVLALGNFPPPTPFSAECAYDSPRYFNRAWEPGALDDLGADDALLLIGTGLTSVDMLVTLKRNNHRGRIYAISRRGLWPLELGPADRYPDWLANQQFTTVTTLMRAVRQETERAHRQDQHWAGVINAMRPHMAALWAALPDAEQRRFLRHVRAYWDAARHRIPPESTYLINAMRASGQLTTWRGRLRTLHETAKGLRAGIGQRDGTLRQIDIARAVNCAGAESNYKQLKDPLVVNLTRRQLVQADALHLGLRAGSDGALVGADGNPSPFLFTLGPCMKGRLWETTAVPEIRVQAERLAENIVQQLGARPDLTVESGVRLANFDPTA